MANVKYVQADKNDAGAIPSQTLVETESQGDGSQRQVVKVGESALPTGAATSAKQSDGTQKTQIVDAGGAVAGVEARKQTPTGNALNVQIGPGDVISNIPVVMEFGQHQVHEGESHGYGYYSTSVSTISFGLTVPVFANTIQAPHLIIHAQIYEGAAELSLWEGSTFTGGSAATSYNRNRNSATVPAMTIKYGVTVTAPGTRLPYTQFISASNKGAGESRSLDEIVLKSNTIYTVVFEEISPISRCVVHLEWYEDLGV